MRITGIVLGCVLVAGIVALAWLLFQFAFNTVTGIFGGPTITYWQAAGCSVALGMLTSVVRGLFKGNGK